MSLCVPVCVPGSNFVTMSYIPSPSSPLFMVPESDLNLCERRFLRRVMLRFEGVAVVGVCIYSDVGSGVGSKAVRDFFRG